MEWSATRDHRLSLPNCQPVGSALECETSCFFVCCMRNKLQQRARAPSCTPSCRAWLRAWMHFSYELAASQAFERANARRAAVIGYDGHHDRNTSRAPRRPLCPEHSGDTRLRPFEADNASALLLGGVVYHQIVTKLLVWSHLDCQT